MNLDIIKSQTFLQTIEWHSDLASTNTYLLENSSLFTELPVLVGANRQSSGRGRGRNVWWASDGALTFSLLIEPKEYGLTQALWPLLSLTVGAAFVESLSLLFPGILFQVKWPNDIYANGRKLSGILIETLPEQSNRLVIGVGLNVNNSLDNAPVDIRQRATALIDLTQEEYPPGEILINCLNQLELSIRLLAENTSAVISHYRTHCILQNKTVTIDTGSEFITGQCLGIDDDGALRLSTEYGEQRYFGGTIADFH